MTYDASEVGSLLLKPQDVDANLRRIPLGTPALKSGSFPSCSLSKIEIPKEARKFASEYGNPANKYTGANFGQIAAIFRDAESASAAFKSIVVKVNSCPKKRTVPAKRLLGGHFTIKHDDTWKVTSGELSGWNWIRGFEKDTYPKSSSILNVFYIAYDYAIRGNVIIASMYWERVKPSVTEERITRRASDLLTKQLRQFH